MVVTIPMWTGKRYCRNNTWIEQIWFLYEFFATHRTRCVPHCSAFDDQRNSFVSTANCTAVFAAAFTGASAPVALHLELVGTPFINCYIGAAVCWISPESSNSLLMVTSSICPPLGTGTWNRWCSPKLASCLNLTISWRAWSFSSWPGPGPSKLAHDPILLSVWVTPVCGSVSTRTAAIVVTGTAAIVVTGTAAIVVTGLEGLSSYWWQWKDNSL